MINDQIQSYFKAEKAESLLFMVVGAIAIAAALVFWLVIKKNFFTGLAIPFVLIGMIQVVVGSTVYFRTDKQVVELSQLYAADPVQFHVQEVNRMRKVNQNFSLYKIIEIVLLSAGLFILAINRHIILQNGWFNDHLGGGGFWAGIGAGLIVQSTFMLCADLFAERRADIYTSQVEQVRPMAD